jgi:DNA-binding CsgD family transcriptional regulator
MVFLVGCGRIRSPERRHLLQSMSAPLCAVMRRPPEPPGDASVGLAQVSRFASASTARTLARRRPARSGRGDGPGAGAMHEDEADRAAIMATLRAETEAWARRDFAALAEHWVHSPQTRHMASFPAIGSWVDEGWEAVAARLRTIMARHPQPYDIAERVHWERVNIVVAGDMAWISYDQVGTDEGDDLDLIGVQHKLDVLQRIDGAWKISCQVLMQQSAEQRRGAMVEVDAGARVLRMNAAARARLGAHPGLVVAAGRLRARHRDRERALREAVAQAHEELKGVAVLGLTPELARPVPLGRDDAGAPMHCWVIVEDGKTLVAIDDAESVARRIERAREVYHLSPAQVRLAALIVEGHDLIAAAATLGVSVNTLRTQLQRIFEKTGVRGQPALVGVLLSVRPPVR